MIGATSLLSQVNVTHSHALQHACAQFADNIIVREMDN